MKRSLAVVGAPSSIGIKTYDDGTVRWLDRAPGVLRQQGLVQRLAARDYGDVVPPAYADLVRPEGRVRNEAGLMQYVAAVAKKVGQAAAGGSFVVTVGGDCSIVLGCLLGVGAHERSVGLVYLDAHSDFATPETSRTGSAASMCFALALGRGDSPLARLAPTRPLVAPRHAVIIGRRDLTDPWYGHEALDQLGVLDLDDAALRDQGPEAIAAAALERVTQPGVDGFWIHLDADVLDPAEMPAVDSPEPGGPRLDTMTRLLRPLVDHPRALGLEITIYDPRLDPGLLCASRLVSLLEHTLGNGAPR